MKLAVRFTVFAVTVFAATLRSGSTAPATPAPAVSAPAPAVSAATPAEAAATLRPLREIGRVRTTTPLCRATLSDAIRAVDIETANGEKLVLAETTLQTVDLDTSPLAKAKGVREITRQFVALRAGAVAGQGLMHDFREHIAAATSDEQRTNLKLFADALDGALHRQKTLADDIGRLIAYLDAHEPVTAEDHDRAVFNAIARQGDLRYPLGPFDARNFGPLATVSDTLSTTAKNAAAELTRRAQPILDDENAAADRIEPAFAKC